MLSHKETHLKKLAQQIVTDAEWLDVVPVNDQIHQKPILSDTFEDSNKWLAHLASFFNTYQNLYSTQYQVVNEDSRTISAHQEPHFPEPEILPSQNQRSQPATEIPSPMTSKITDNQNFISNRTRKAVNKGDERPQPASPLTKEDKPKIIEDLSENLDENFDINLEQDLTKEPSAERHHPEFFTRQMTEEFEELSQSAQIPEKNLIANETHNLSSASDHFQIQTGNDNAPLEHQKSDASPPQIISGFEHLVHVITQEKEKNQLKKPAIQRIENGDYIDTSLDPTGHSLSKNSMAKSSPLPEISEQSQFKQYERHFETIAPSEDLLEQLSKKILKSFNKYYKRSF